MHPVVSRDKIAPIMSKPDDVELGKWQRGETERWILVRLALGLRYNYVPKILGWNISFGRLAASIIRGLCLVVLVAWPIGLKRYDNAISWSVALWLVAGLLFVNTYAYFHDKIVSSLKPRRVRRRLLERLSLHAKGTVGSVAHAVKLRNQDHKPAVDAAIKEVLSCIRRVAEIHLGDYERAFLEVTLLVFDDPDCKRMRIAERTTEERLKHVVIESEEIMAYHVAKSGTHRAINDFANDSHPFRKTGLSASTFSYRSILLIPILDRSSTGKEDSCVGVITIDSQRPYHFWPGRGNELAVKVSPFCTWVRLLLSLNDTELPRIPCNA